MEALKKQCLSLFPLILFSLILLGGRFYVSESWLFAFLNWNLFLAFIPWGVSWALQFWKPNSKIIFWFGISVWLLFFPNAPYLVTDFFHLKPRNIIPLWYDTLLFMSYAWAGVLLGIWSLRNIQKLLQERWKSAWKSHGAMFFLCLLSGFGIYLGRFLRFNTWDIVRSPIEIIQGGLALLQADESIHFGIIFSLVWGLFIWTSYISLRYQE